MFKGAIENKKLTLIPPKSEQLPPESEELRQLSKQMDAADAAFEQADEDRWAAHDAVEKLRKDRPGRGMMRDANPQELSEWEGRLREAESVLATAMVVLDRLDVARREARGTYFRERLRWERGIRLAEYQKDLAERAARNKQAETARRSKLRELLAKLRG